MFWIGRDYDDPFGRWADLPENLEKERAQIEERIQNHMSAVREAHQKDCETDPEKKLFLRIGRRGYWKCLPGTKTIDVEHYAKEWSKPVEVIRKEFEEEGYNV